MNAFPDYSYHLGADGRVTVDCAYFVIVFVQNICTQHTVCGACPYRPWKAKSCTVTLPYIGQANQPLG